MVGTAGKTATVRPDTSARLRSIDSTSSAVATVVGCTAAIIDVANPDERLRPGMTAEVTVVGARQANVVRIPNSALAFRPAPEVLLALGEADVSAADTGLPATARSGAWRDVWEYDGTQFTPIAVHVGLADSRWTELLSGPIRPGDVLVTSAALRQRSDCNP